jgi:hypothetical protein
MPSAWILGHSSVATASPILPVHPSSRFCVTPLRHDPDGARVHALAVSLTVTIVDLF